MNCEQVSLESLMEALDSLSEGLCGPGLLNTSKEKAGMLILTVED